MMRLDGANRNLIMAGEVASLLRVHRSTVYRWAREGWLPSYRYTDGAIRFDRNEVVRWIENRHKRVKL